MYKYNLLYSDWYGDLSMIYLKIDAHVHSITNYEIGVLQVRSENCAKPAIAPVSPNLLTLFFSINEFKR